MKLIVMTGLPASGKSAIAEALGQALQIPVFSLDWLRGAMRPYDLVPDVEGYIAYDLLTTLARRQLMLGQSAILDSVASPDAVRGAWRDLAYDFYVPLYVIRCICSKPRVHQNRLRKRQRRIAGWHELTWQDVKRVQSYYTVWNHTGITLDSVNPLTDNIERALKFVQMYDAQAYKSGQIN